MRKINEERSVIWGLSLRVPARAPTAKRSRVATDASQKSLVVWWTQTFTAAGRPAVGQHTQSTYMAVAFATAISKLLFFSFKISNKLYWIFIYFFKLNKLKRLSISKFFIFI